MIEPRLIHAEERRTRVNWGDIVDQVLDRPQSEWRECFDALVAQQAVRPPQRRIVIRVGPPPAEPTPGE